jgi:hypothetical protein
MVPKYRPGRCPTFRSTLSLAVRSTCRGVLTAAAFVAVLVVAPAAPAARTVSLSLYVSFFANGTIAMTSPDGAAVGTTSGSPTVVPAGYYTLVFSGPGGCTLLPNFRLSGPGTNLITTLTEAQGQKNPTGVNLLPSSTYTWSSDAVPGVVHTFVTSAQVEGSPPTASTSSGTYSSSGKQVTSQDIVGSAVTATRGTLDVTLSAAGKLALAYRGKSVRHLQAGKYTVVVTDSSPSKGFTLQKLAGSVRSLSAPAFTGKRTAAVTLTSGRWLFAAERGLRERRGARLRAPRCSSCRRRAR